MNGLPDPDRAYALLIGVEDFTDPTYRSLPSSYRSVDQLARMLGDPDGDMWRLRARPDEHRISVLGPRVTVDQARRALHAATNQENLDSLLVCISCHGRRYDGWYRTPGLHLAMTDSDADIGGTHWHFDEISQELARARHRIKHILLIVDACFADGLSVPQGQGGGDSVDHLGVPGVVVLSATMDRVQAWPNWLGTGWTAFLGALIQSIIHGVRGPQTVLTAKNIFTAAAGRLADARASDRNIPEPSIWIAGRSEIPLCRNNDYLQPRKPAGDDAGESASVFMYSDDCFEAIGEAHDRSRDESIAGIIRAFVANEDSAMGEVATFVKELGTSEFSGFSGDAYSALCNKRSTEDVAAFIDCLHNRDAEVDAGSIVKELAKREDGGHAAAEVYQRLLNRGCPECDEEAEIFAALIVDDGTLSPGALAIWR